MRPCGRDGTLRLAILVRFLAFGRWQRMLGLRYLRHFVMEWSGSDRCEGKVRWKEVASEVEEQWRVEYRLESGVESALQSGVVSDAESE